MSNLLFKGEDYTHRDLFDESASLKREYSLTDAWNYMVLRLEGHKVKVESLEDIPFQKQKLLDYYRDELENHQDSMISYIDQWGIDIFLHAIDVVGEGLYDLDWKLFKYLKSKALLTRNIALSRIEKERTRYNYE